MDQGRREETRIMSRVVLCGRGVEVEDDRGRYRGPVGVEGAADGLEIRRESRGTADDSFNTDESQRVHVQDGEGEIDV